MHNIVIDLRNKSVSIAQEEEGANGVNMLDEPQAEPYLQESHQR